MSQTRRFEEPLADAAECYVEQLGVETAIAELAERRREDETGRAAEALAYLKREYSEVRA